MTKNTRRFWLFLMFCALAGPALAVESLVTLRGHVPSLVQRSTLVERAPADEPVQLSLVVNIDQGLMDQTLNDIYGPDAPMPRLPLSPDELAQKFDLANKRQILEDFARASGLTVDTTQEGPGSTLVKVSGPARVIENVFHIQLNHYRGPDGKVFRSHAVDPAIPASLVPHLKAIVGLSNNTGVVHPHLHFSTALSQPVLGGMTGYNNQSLSPTDIKNIYKLNGSTLTGSGQTVALVEFDGYNPSDITAYEDYFHISHITVTPVNINGTANPVTAGPYTDEVCLDIEMVAALAPGVSQILVYESTDTSDSGIANMYQKIQSDNRANIVSTSWGGNEASVSQSLYVSENTSFSLMAGQLMTVYAAAGDSGAYDACGNTTLVVDDPASQTYVTGVGGTSLSNTVSSPVEKVWNEGYFSNACQISPYGPAYEATGGGVSSHPIPNYQSGVTGLASTQNRNVPDVALNADPGSSPYSVYVGGSWQRIGGTSAGAPLWAAYTALINQNLPPSSPLGFANQTFYPYGKGSSYSSYFNDITSGNNGYYTAGTGYDNCTGFGSFKGLALAGVTPATNQGTLPLSSIYPYPNPWDARKSYATSTNYITFSSIPLGIVDNAAPSGFTVKIFTISGFLVRTITAYNTSATWDLTNDDGQAVASGLYIYVVSLGGSSASGKLAIIR